MNKAAFLGAALLGIAIACGIAWLADWRILVVSLLVVATAIAVLRWHPPGETTHTQRTTPVHVSPQTWLEREIQRIPCQADSSDPRVATAVTAPVPSPLPAHTDEEQDINLQPLTIVRGELKDRGDPVKRRLMNFPPAKWPLRFTGSFGYSSRCVNTQHCSVPYGNLQLGQSDPMRATADTYSHTRLDAFTGCFISPEFAAPVLVTWRSQDGQDHQAKVDLEAIFGDRRLLHLVPREEVAEMPSDNYGGIPDLLIEVNDRSIHVYNRY